jgi:hypothetical protein
LRSTPKQEKERTIQELESKCASTGRHGLTSPRSHLSIFLLNPIQGICGILGRQQGRKAFWQWCQEVVNDSSQPSRFTWTTKVARSNVSDSNLLTSHSMVLNRLRTIPCTGPQMRIGRFRLERELSRPGLPQQKSAFFSCRQDDAREGAYQSRRKGRIKNSRFPVF